MTQIPFGRVNAPARAIGLMLIGSAFLAWNDAVTKWLARDFPVGQVLCLRSAFILVPLLVIVFTVAKTATGLWTNMVEVHVPTVHQVSSLLFNFELWIGMVLPFFLMLGAKRSDAKTQVVAGGLVIVALFIGRYEYVVGGQLVPLFQGSWQPDLIAYTPSMTEIGIVVLAVSIGILLYAFGDKKLSLSATPNQ